MRLCRHIILVDRVFIANDVDIMVFVAAAWWQNKKHGPFYLIVRTISVQSLLNQTGLININYSRRSQNVSKWLKN